MSSQNNDPCHVSKCPIRPGGSVSITKCEHKLSELVYLDICSHKSRCSVRRECWIGAGALFGSNFEQVGKYWDNRGLLIIIWSLCTDQSKNAIKKLIPPSRSPKRFWFCHFAFPSNLIDFTFIGLKERFDLSMVRF